MSSALEPIPSRESAAALGRAIAAGRLDPVALTETYLEAAEASPDVYAHVVRGRALRAAVAARHRAAAGLRRGPLDGVPISWKDLIDLAGAPCEGGSRLLAGRVPERDAAVVARADHAGLPPLGKTHLPEFAFSGLGVNPMTATPRNAFDAARAPGGSSSGAAISVTRGAAAAAIGSDTGGSVRIPAAWSGLVGLKTTVGMIPTEGVLPLAPSMDTIGPLARTVEDVALLTAVLADRRPADLAGARADRLAFYVVETVMLDAMPDDRRAAFEAAVARIAAAGATVHRGPAPEIAEVHTLLGAGAAIVNTEAYACWRDRIEARPDLMWPRIRDRMRSGARVSGDRAEHARLTSARLSGALVARLAGYDAWLAPTTPNAPPLLAALEASDETYVAENLLALRNTRIANVFGLASLTLPAGRDALGLPCGLMLTGAPFSEARLLRAGAALEPLLAAL